MHLAVAWPDGEEVAQMRNAIAAIMAILGTILVLGGVTALWGPVLLRPQAEPAEDGRQRTAEVLGRLPSPERLLAWGVVLLALSAVTAGAVTISITATTD